MRSDRRQGMADSEPGLSGEEVRFRCHIAELACERLMTPGFPGNNFAHLKAALNSR